MTSSALPGGVDLTKESAARSFARRSRVELFSGAGDCRLISEHHPTLGDAFRWHEKRANVRNSMQCKRMGERWICEASFIFNEKRMRENDWALSLKFSVDAAGVISELECGAAG